MDNPIASNQDPKSEYAAVIPRFVTRILQGKPPVIYGDGQQTRDFTFVKDVVKANILAGMGDAAHCRYLERLIQEMSAPARQWRTAAPLH